MKPPQSFSTQARVSKKNLSGCKSMTTFEVLPSPKKEFHFISQDLPRKLIIPRTGMKHRKGVITEEKFENLMKAASLNVKEEEEAMKLEKAKMKEQLLEQQEKRRLEFEAWDSARKKNEKLSELEEEAKQKMEYLREKANEAIKEQNEEIKEINKLILSAKVQAIRNSQMEEKKLIQKEHKLFEESLDNIMEKERIKGIMKERDVMDQRKENALRAASKLQEQIKSNTDRRLLDEERKIKEGELLIKKLQQDQQRDYQEMKMQQIKKHAFREELIKDNEELARRKQLMKAQSEKEDLIISEFQKLKAAQEEAKEIAEREAKLKKEKELSKMREMHGRAEQLQAEQDALRARRAQEEKERQYRKKEKEDALRKKTTMENLKMSRAEQLKHQEKLRQLKADADFKEMKIQLKKIEEETKEEKRKELSKKLSSLQHLKELKSQIRKKEMEKMNEKKEFYKEGIHLQQETKRQAEMLDVLKREKLNELRKYNIPETYINHIKRKVNLEE